MPTATITKKPKTGELPKLRTIQVIEIISTQKETLKGFRFVLAARAKENTRYALRYVQVAKDKIVATDGRKLHIFNYPNDYETGLYEVLINGLNHIILVKTETNENFPKWQDIVPKHQKHFPIYLEGADSAAQVCAVLGKNDIGVRSEYLSPIISLQSCFDVYFKNEGSPICFMNEKYMAIVMPLSISKIEVEIGETSNAHSK